MTLRSAAIGAVERLQRAGHEAYLVGGCVRDRLLGLPEKDYDIATGARPEQVAALFDGTKFVGARFGVSLITFGDHQFEVATFRRDGIYVNHRHPESVDFGTVEDDSTRRDFTMNALFEDPISGTIRDFHGGREDLARRVLRCVGDPTVRFREDALRLMRAVRFAARFGFTIDATTWQAMCDLAPTIQYISPERHRVELNAMLVHPSASRAIRLMEDCGLLEFLLPEIRALHGVEQGTQFHPEGDVFVHTMLVLDHVEPRTVETVWGALLHDVGKPATFARDPETRRISFIDHQRIGAAMADVILERLRFSNEERERISAIVARHMTFMECRNMKQSTLRRFLSGPTIESDLAVHRADCLGSSGQLDYWDFCREALARLPAEQQVMLPKPLIDGRDAIAAGFQPGPALGQLLREAMDLQLDGQLNTREEALSWLAGRATSAG
ncbi:HDIG domain-containing protein [bacterium]|nr:HDIG domain-containing protein [bacterium]